MTRTEDECPICFGIGNDATVRSHHPISEDTIQAMPRLRRDGSPHEASAAFCLTKGPQRWQRGENGGRSPRRHLSR
jgi:hypothetical protein